MKSLDSLLSTLHLRSALQNRVVLGEPWGVRLPARPHAGKFHFMEQGSGQLCVPECAATTMRQGHFAIVMTDREHTVQDLTGSRPTPLLELLRQSDILCASGITLRFGGAGAETSVVSGDFDFAESAHHPLIRLLPPCLILRGNGTTGAPGLDAVLKVLTSESMAAQPGATALLDRLCDVLFIQAIRGWVHTGDGNSGLPAAVQDTAIDGALHLIQSEPASEWTVESLAREVALSLDGGIARPGSCPFTIGVCGAVSPTHRRYAHGVSRTMEGALCHATAPERSTGHDGGGLPGGL